MRGSFRVSVTAALLLCAGRLAASAKDVCPAGAPCASAAADSAQDEHTALLQHASVAFRAAREVRAHSFANASHASRPVMTNVQWSFEMLANAEGHVLQVNIGHAHIVGMDKGHMPYSDHFQSVQRAQGTNTIYLSASNGEQGAGLLVVAELGSRPAAGAMGSNMAEQKRPPAQDAIKQVIAVDQVYQHAGGMDSFENILAIGVEPACEVSARVSGGCKTAGRVHFYDTTDPLNPKELPYTVERSGITAGTVSLTRQDDGKFLLVVGGTDAAQLDFYISQTTSLLNGNPGFQKVLSWTSKSLLVDAGSDSDYGAYQTMNFVQQTDGSLFLVGLFRSMNGLGSDYADLFKVDSNSHGISLTKKSSIKLKCEPSTCNFQAAAGLYIASPDTLLVYASDWEPHWEDGSLFINEFRPKFVGVGGQCERITPGSCGWSDCSHSRGPTDCIDEVCICQEGFCHNGDGKCIAYSSR
mmetsp:Transcript_104678/g.265740  ORF Transcript_104678/g.265740 Transcript_104678/m.265740 type:complete len:469 (+) Transcript_104678:56-1462(+)